MVELKFDDTIIFPHIPRTGGTSFADALGVRGHHMTMKFFNDNAPEAVRGLPTVSIIRNPLDQMISWFYKLPNRRHETFREWGEGGFKTKWNLPRYRKPEDRLPGPIRQDLYIEVDGKCAVEFLLRFETLHVDFGWFCGYVLGLENAPVLNHLQKGEGSRSRKEHWTPALLKIAEPIMGPFAEKYKYPFRIEG